VANCFIIFNLGPINKVTICPADNLGMISNKEKEFSVCQQLWALPRLPIQVPETEAHYLPLSHAWDKYVWILSFSNGLFNDMFNSSDYMALHDRMTKEQWVWKWMCPNLRYYLGISLKGLKNPREDSWVLQNTKHECYPLNHDVQWVCGATPPFPLVVFMTHCLRTRTTLSLTLTSFRAVL
jgi:hypothetical protein